MFSRLIAYIRSITRGYRTLNRNDSIDVEKSTEETPLIIKGLASPNPFGDDSDDKSKGIEKSHPNIEISEQFDIDLSLQAHTNQSETVFVDPAIKKQIDESYDTIDCTSQMSSNASELLPSEQHPRALSGFFELVFKATHIARETLSKMENEKNEQSDRFRYNSEIFNNALELHSFEQHPRALSGFFELVFKATHVARETLSKMENEKNEQSNQLRYNSETLNNASELCPSEQYSKALSGFFESVFKAAHIAAENLSKIENEQSNRLGYNSETCIPAPSSNPFPRSPEAIQSSINALETMDEESS
ncbi:uncharacterized protein EAE97_000865 [Botrytis byssoidea]|uniref:Uncharacterized protein n=1 Tax=Botrytis byssoidea TaxID=139641 RepID=A0A9P5LYL9_9HELO|nr:uncharacterized protein EAE97_000865 [Botrytis byssoidea]KAF7953466.1 hypothetical protein EAE97_000865 [Botrytis byssoidea]